MNLIPKVSRNERVAVLLKKEMSLLLRDMKFGNEYMMVAIGAVVVTRDLKAANIYVDYFSHTESSGPDQEGLLKSLEKNMWYFKKMLAKRMSLKYMPSLKFCIDKESRATRRVNDIIDSL